MPYYAGLKQIQDAAVRQRTIAGLQRLARLKPTGKAGVFDFFEHVYRMADAPEYAAERLTKPGRSFKDWRTFCMSDHLPMWIELCIDDGDAYLDALANS